VRNFLRSVFFVISIGLLAQPCTAQTIRLGLWEQWFQPSGGGTGPMADIARKIDEGNRKMKEKLVALEPEKRLAIEQEMAASGVDLRLDKPDGVISTQHCIDAKEIARVAAEKEAQKGNCKRTVSSKTEGVIVEILECKGKTSKQSMTSTFTYYGDKAYTITMPMVTVGSRWLREDCGNSAK
jgi:hypothetical protein